MYIYMYTHIYIYMYMIIIRGEIESCVIIRAGITNIREEIASCEQKHTL